MQEELYIRVKQALTWLKRNKGILQKDIADKMGMQETSFTRGLARVKEKDDESFVISLHSAVKEFISLDYLLHGIGELVVNNESIQSTDSNMSLPDYSSLFNAAIAAKDETITSYQQQLSSKDELIQTLRNQLSDKDSIIEAKDNHIATLKRRITELHNELTKRLGQDISGYPFPIGVSEDKKSAKK